MNKNFYQIKKKVYFFSAYKWIALVLFLLLLLCLTLKCCDYEKTTNVNNQLNEQNQNNGSALTPNKPKQNVLPSSENIRLIPIDSSQIIEDKNDPLGRFVVKELVNVYLHDNVEIKDFVLSLKDQFPNDSIVTNYYAEVYKRVQLRVDENRKELLKETIKKDTVNVKFVTNEWVYGSFFINKDPGFADKQNKWFYEYIGVFEAWKITQGSSDVKIAVLDDGFDLNHIEIKNNYQDQWNVFDYSSNVYANPKNHFHGTHVAGSIVGEQNNNFGISGVAPNCKIIPIQISNGSGIITMTSLLDGIFYALKNKANIINLSLGLSLGKKVQELSDVEQDLISKNVFLEEQELWDEVFEIVKNDGVIIVQAAGNDHVLANIDPMKRSENTIIVGAINQKGELAEFTNYGSKITVYAPGKQIYSSLPGNQMGFLDGTSMATPIISGCVALYISKNRNYEVKEVIELFAKQNRQNTSFNINELINMSL
ncbi:hypothetical protein EVU94_13970 [Flavobacteriaceae bacterium 144Ye]|nr:hypothetical protein EVU94_13970 [Flavobacteriaceae bacterium 144Ye]